MQGKKLCIPWCCFFPSRFLSSTWEIIVFFQSASVSHSVMSNSLRPARPLCLWNSPSKNTGVRSLSLLQGIFPTRGSNPGLLHWRQILYCLSHINFFLMWMTISQSKEKEETISGNWAILNVLSQNKVKFRSQWISAGLEGQYAYPITPEISNHLHWLPPHHKILHTRIFPAEAGRLWLIFSELGAQQRREF